MSKRGRENVLPKRGDIFAVNFDPTIGSEIKKTRPAVILQNDIANRHSPITIVAAITSHRGGKIYPTEVSIKASEGGLTKDSLVLLNQIRSIDKRRLVRKIGKISSNSMVKINIALQISLGLIDL